MPPQLLTLTEIPLKHHQGGMRRETGNLEQVRSHQRVILQNNLSPGLCDHLTPWLVPNRCCLMNSSNIFHFKGP